MSIALIQENFEDMGGDTVTLTGVTPGNLVMFLIGGASATSITSVSDTHNTYTHATNSFGRDPIGVFTDIWYSIVSTGGSLTISYAFSGGPQPGDSRILRAVEFSGMNTSTPVINGAATNATGVLTGPTVATTSTGDWVITFFNQFMNAETMDSPFTEFDANGSFPGGWYAPGSVGSFHATASGGGTDIYAVSAAVIKAPSGSNPALPTTSLLIF